MKLTILGGGGVRMPAFVRSVLTGGAHHFDELCLLEPDQVRRDTTGRLAVEIASALGRPGTVTVTPDVAQALTGADFVFSALRVGGDRGRVIDEQRVQIPATVRRQFIEGQAGLVMAVATAVVALMWLTIARSLQRGRQWARITVLMLCVLTIAATGYDAWRLRDGQLLVGLPLPLLYVLLLNTRAARSWFRWGTW